MAPKSYRQLDLELRHGSSLQWQGTCRVISTGSSGDEDAEAVAIVSARWFKVFGRNSNACDALVVTRRYCSKETCNLW